MNRIKELVDHSIRRVSSSCDYKYSGFSYVLSIYSINRDNFSENQLEFLLNPHYLTNILNSNSWAEIKETLQSLASSPIENAMMSNRSKVFYSWSGLAIVGSESSKLFQLILDFELYLQATWFYFDSLIDNLNQDHYSLIDLENMKSAKSMVSLQLNHIISANISTLEKNALTGIKNSADLTSLEEKLDLIFENKIAREQAISTSRQQTYGILVEILLLILTLLQIIEPVRDLINGDFSSYDYFICFILFLIFIVTTYFIIRRDK